jgi:C-terminal processing protease CtpA/Prc
VRIPAIEEKYFKELKLGYISLNNVFGNNVAREFSKSLKNLEEKNIEGLIIDLRNN